MCRVICVYVRNRPSFAAFDTPERYGKRARARGGKSPDSREQGHAALGVCVFFRSDPRRAS